LIVGVTKHVKECLEQALVSMDLVNHDQVRSCRDLPGEGWCPSATGREERALELESCLKRDRPRNGPHANRLEHRDPFVFTEAERLFPTGWDLLFRKHDDQAEPWAL
jgi:hypothetical protein